MPATLGFPQSRISQPCLLAPLINRLLLTRSRLICYGHLSESVRNWHGICSHPRQKEQQVKVAVPIWNGRISPVFDTAQRLLLIEFENGIEVARVEEAIGQIPIPRRAAALTELNVDVLVCGAVSRPLFAMLSGAGMTVVPFVSGGIDEVLNAFIEGRLSDPRLCMPGCRGRRRFRRRPRRPR